MSDFGRWGNWDTREVWLWLNNDYGLYQTTQRMASRLSECELARELPALFTEFYPLELNTDHTVVMADVDWDVIAETLVEEVEAEA